MLVHMHYLIALRTAPAWNQTLSVSLLQPVTVLMELSPCQYK